jgi:hypothetical protein
MYWPAGPVQLGFVADDHEKPPFVESSADIVTLLMPDSLSWTDADTSGFWSLVYQPDGESRVHSSGLAVSAFTV